MQMPRSLQDNFDMSRIPLRPLAYENKALAFTHELLVDSTGENPTYHIFITDPEDNSKFIDLSAMILKEGLDSKDLTIKIDGVDEPLALNELIAYIYKRFLHINDIGGFRVDRDMPILFDKDNKNVLLQDINGSIVFPVVRTESVFDSSGISLKDKIDAITHLAYTRDVLIAEIDNQKVFNGTYPFLNYPIVGNYMEFRKDGLVISPDRYHITDKTNTEGDVYGFNLSFPLETFPIGSKIEILYLYNTESVSDTIPAIDGHKVTSKSLSTAKLEKVSDNYMLNDSSSIASSKAVFNLFRHISDAMSAVGGDSFFVKDMSTTNQTIIISMTNENFHFTNNYVMLHILTASSKMDDVTLRILYNNNGYTVTKELELSLPEGGIGANRMLRVLVNDQEAVLFDVATIKLNRGRYTHFSYPDEKDISFADLDYDQSTGLIDVYRNGIKLFEDIDYSINYMKQTITLFVPTTASEKIIFESQYISE